MMGLQLWQSVWLGVHERIWREEWKLDVVISVRERPVIERNFHIQ